MGGAKLKGDKEEKQRHLKRWRALWPRPPRAWVDFFSLGLLRAADAGVWLLLTPLLVGRLGIATFGLIAVVQVLLNYGKTIMDYGFHITGVRSVALHSEAPRVLQRVLWEAIGARVLLGGLYFAGLAGAMAGGMFSPAYTPIFLWAAPFLLAHALFTDWFFIGLQRVSYVAAAILAARLGFAASVVALVRQPADGVFLFFLHGMTALPASIALLLVLRFRWRLRFPLPSRGAIGRLLRSDFRLLLSNLAIELNHSFPLLALNLLTTHTVTGYFSVIQKLAQPVRFLLVIFSQTIFPIACKRIPDGAQAVWAFLLRVVRRFSPLPLAACVALAWWSAPLLTYFAGSAPEEIIRNFRLFLLVPLVVLLNIPAYQYLLAYEKKRIYSRIYLGSLLVNIPLSLLLASWMELSGVVFAVLIVETLITLSLHGWAARMRRNPAGA